ncbi:Cytochrome P450 monooxygenase TRI1 [Colletotrichum spinosum]|uniref:Cytochrome P450 monooxygenase TRI1 n=1 Tax=Colletotrichum spinosum TaxID=1347390 RepID=A0A4R8PZA1_9PEZI|nr:Cytochrome P450 monooxygenase TRI1 [Colletotrichum spinosum]
MAAANESLHSPTWGALDSLQSFPSPFEKPVPYFITAFLLFVFYFSVQQGEQTPTSAAPLINPKNKWDFTGLKSKYDFTVYIKWYVKHMDKKQPDDVYRIATDCGDLTVLPAVPFANEIRNHEDLSFDRVLDKNFHAYLPGFEPMQEASTHKTVLKHVIRTRLTQFLAKLTAPISDETTKSLNEAFGDADEWKTVVLKDSMTRVIARVSTRIFGGEELANNEKWLKITSEYARTSFFASEVLRFVPKPLRWIAHQLIPFNRKVQSQMRDARRIVNPIVEKRRQEKKAAADRDEDEPEYMDCLDWCEEAGDDANPADPATMQLALSFAGVHTSSSLLTQIMLDLARNPEFFEPLRKEISEVIRTDGWSKMGLYKMRLLDSVCKETQRINPIGMVMMHREATKPITLSNGLELPEGTRIAVSGQLMRDFATYADPGRFDGYRYLCMRERLGNGNDGAAHFVSTSPEHLGFGHGQHACPGRFFAANEIKIILCHLLMKYDWRMAPNVRPSSNHYGYTIEVDPKAKIEIRRRDVIDLGPKA